MFENADSGRHRSPYKKFTRDILITISDASLHSSSNTIIVTLKEDNLSLVSAVDFHQAILFLMISLE